MGEAKRRKKLDPNFGKIPKQRKAQLDVELVAMTLLNNGLLLYKSILQNPMAFIIVLDTILPVSV